MPKYLCHVPTEQYGYISVEVEGTADEAMLAYREIKRARANVLNFEKVLLEYLTTGEIKMGGNYVFSDSQKEVLKQVKKLLKTNNK